MDLRSLFGVREFHYRYNSPILVRYIFSDSDLLNELNKRFYPDSLADGLATADLSVLREYQSVIRFRDTQIYDVEMKAALRKIWEGINELIALRLLAGEDRHVIREDTLQRIEDITL